MSRKIKITVSETIGEWLDQQAAQSGMTTSALAAMLVTNQVNIMRGMKVEMTPPAWGGKRDGAGRKKEAGD